MIAGWHGSRGVVRRLVVVGMRTLAPGPRERAPLSTAVVGDGLIMLKRVPCDITCHMQMLCLPPDDPLLRVRWALTEPGNKANSNQACIEYC